MKSIAAFILALAANIGCLTVAFAQPAPIAGKDYTLLQTPQPVPSGQIEVIEFFGYWCPIATASRTRGNLGRRSRARMS